MKTKEFRLFVQLGILMGILGSSCSIRSQHGAPATPNPTGYIAEAGTPTRLPTPLPTLKVFGMETPSGTPYPAARTIQGEVIAFLVPDEGSSSSASLWVANVDGSGERRLVENIDNSQASIWRAEWYFWLEWSPDGKWISYNANDALWLISPDGSIVRKFLSLPDKSKGTLFSWSWSPDGSQIAYSQTPAPDANPRHASIGIVDVPSGQVHPLLDFDFGYTVSLSWTPDGRFLWLNGPSSFVKVEAASGKVVQDTRGEPEPNCWTGFFDAIMWSPDGEWFAITEHGVGYGGNWFCLKGVDGASLSRLSVGSTSDPVWDHARNVLYFVARKINVHSDPNFDADQRLMRYDISTRKLEKLLSLGRTTDYLWCVSLSPAGRMLELHGALADRQEEFVLLNMNTYSGVQYRLDLKAWSPFGPCWATDWSSDGRNVVVLANAPPPPSPFPNGMSRYFAFYALNVETGQPTVISGLHEVSEWAISPVPVNP